MSLAPLLLTLPAFAFTALEPLLGTESTGEKKGEGGGEERERESESTRYRRSRILHHSHGRRRRCPPGGSLGFVRRVRGDAAVAHR